VASRVSQFDAGTVVVVALSVVFAGVTTVSVVGATAVAGGPAFCWDSCVRAAEDISDAAAIPRINPEQMREYMWTVPFLIDVGDSMMTDFVAVFVAPR
jgi:hypothetical protein